MFYFINKKKIYGPYIKGYQILLNLDALCRWPPEVDLRLEVQGWSSWRIS